MKKVYVNNKDQALISVIVPVLNTAGYIRECLESIKNQTYKNLEILCVDGGSTDGTLEILEKYALADDRIQIITDVRGSYGKQINRGIHTAAGEYVAIAEPDDHIALDMYEKLYEEAFYTNADIIKSDYMLFIGDGRNRSYMPKCAADAQWYGTDLSAAVRTDLFNYGPANWSGIYRRQFLLENHICHNNSAGAAFQDIGFWFLAFALAEKIRFIRGYGYHYRLDNPLSSVHSPDKMLGLFDEFTYLEDQLKKHGIAETYEHQFLWQKWIHYVWGFYRTEDSLRCKYLKRVSDEFAEKMSDPGTAAKLSEYQKKEISRLVDPDQKFLEQYYENKSTILKILKEEKACILFGCGLDGINFLLMVRQMGLLNSIKGIIDNDKRMWGKRVLGIEVFSVKEGSESFQDAFYVIASARYGEQMHRQLVDLGIHQKNILIERII